MNAHDLLSNNSSYKGELEELLDIEALVCGVKSSAKLNNASSLLLDFDNRRILYMTPKLLYLENATDKD